MSQTRQPLLLFCLLLGFAETFVAAPSRADSLTITYSSPKTQTVITGSTCCASAIFDGTVTNNTASPIIFQLLATDGSSFYVAGITTNIPFPGVTLGAGASQSFDLTVSINPFDPSLAYPGTVNVVLDAISESAGQPVLTQSDAVVFVTHSVPEPATAMLLLWFCVAAGAAILIRRTVITTAWHF